MTKIKYIAVSCAALMTLAACQTTQENLAESGATKLDKSAVTSVFSGNTVPWSSGEGSSFHAADGNYMYKSNAGSTGSGTWRVSDAGDYCFIVKDWYDTEQCFEIYKKDDQLISVAGDGTRRTMKEGAAGNTL
ncbi:MAG: DUF995 domain-containing protein [Rhodospirillales bacterium]